ncbi:hypothetical protein BDA96_05G164200 [Sorghum bicolor]|uniref:Uncharacterized protein n=2 Tax=Sorghum bicolor TaxID=4558 RepID=A0A921QYB2_SORBI|nr:hypothetical protein BDA96_05G164200 [Sorghum bicolor]OQU83639.1 hypothetical protein SORBI_3005G150501 [Sorghum bicolor]
MLGGTFRRQTRDARRHLPPTLGGRPGLATLGGTFRRRTRARRTQRKPSAGACEGALRPGRRTGRGRRRCWEAAKPSGVSSDRGEVRARVGRQVWGDIGRICADRGDIGRICGIGNRAASGGCEASG